jgi:Ca-activated chloride channel family protein
MPPPAHASWWSDLWKTPDQQGFQALQQGEPERAATLFEDPQWKGVADYRGGDYEGADRKFSADTSAAGTYNRGNALAHQGKYEEAIAAYDATLRANPHDEDAAFNKALLEKLREKKQSGGNDNKESQRNRDNAQSDQPREQSSSGNPNQDESQSRSDQQANKRPETQQQKSDQEQARPSDEEKQQTAEREAPRDEQRDALEQWLRRVPDDPSGLLRRKFQFETNERLRSGVPDPRDQERIW